MIYWAPTKASLNLITPIRFNISYTWFSANQFFWASGLDSTSIHVLVTIYSLSAKGSLNRGAHSWFRCPFFWPSANQFFFPVFDFISSIQFPTVIWSISRGPSQCCSLNLEISPSTLSKSFYFVNSACVYCLSRTRSNFVICLVKLQPAAQSHDLLAQSMISDNGLSFHVILLRLSSTLIKLVKCSVGLLFLMHILIWKFSGCDLLQVVETEASYVLHIIQCFNIIPLSKSQSILFDGTWFMS